MQTRFEHYHTLLELPLLLIFVLRKSLPSSLVRPQFETILLLQQSNQSMRKKLKTNKFRSTKCAFLRIELLSPSPVTTMSNTFMLWHINSMCLCERTRARIVIVIQCVLLCNRSFISFSKYQLENLKIRK